MFNSYADNVALPAFARRVLRSVRRAAIGRYRLLAAVAYAGTDRQTPDSCIDPTPRTMRAVPERLKSNNEPARRQ